MFAYDVLSFISNETSFLKNRVTEVVLSIFWFEDSQVALQVLTGDNSDNNLLIFIKVFTEFLNKLFSSSYSYFSITFCT